MPPKLPAVLILDNVRSLHNVGAIFRTAEATGIQEVVLTGLTPVPPRHEIDKTALGALRTLAWRYEPNAAACVAALKKEGYTAYALELTPTATILYEAPLTWPLALVVGHEREGVEPDVLALCDAHLSLPMHGTSVHSLNVSNATSIALYELGRRFWYHGDTSKS